MASGVIWGKTALMPGCPVKGQILGENVFLKENHLRLPEAAEDVVGLLFGGAVGAATTGADVRFLAGGVEATLGVLAAADVLRGFTAPAAGCAEVLG